MPVGSGDRTDIDFAVSSRCILEDLRNRSKNAITPLVFHEAGNIAYRVIRSIVQEDPIGSTQQGHLEGLCI